jgi:hypothetical protein
MEAVCSKPGRFKLVASGVRRVILRGFPCSILYRSFDESVEVLAIAHHRRRPNYWVNRLTAHEP